MTTKFDSFKEELTALCKIYGVFIASEQYDALELWDTQRAGEIPEEIAQLRNKLIPPELEMKPFSKVLLTRHRGIALWCDKATGLFSVEGDTQQWASLEGLKWFLDSLLLEKSPYLRREE